MMLDTEDTFTLLLTRDMDMDIEEELPEQIPFALHQARSLSVVIFSLVSLVVPLVLGIYYGLGELQIIVSRDYYAREGQPILVAVTACEMIRPQKSSHYPLVDYEYTLLETHYSTQERLAGGSCNPYFVGRRLDALYLPSDPSSARVAQDGAARSPDFLGSTVFLAVFGALSIYCMRNEHKGFQALREKTLLDSGPLSDAAHPFDPLPSHVTSVAWWIVMSMCFSTVFFIVVAQMFMIVGRIINNDVLPTQAAVELVALCLGIVACFLAGIPPYRRLRRAFHALRNRFYVISDGIVMEGEITAISGYTLPNTDDYYVRVWYQFIGPGKKPIKGNAEAQRQDLKNRDLPSVGTRVKVIYKSVQDYMLL